LDQNERKMRENLVVKVTAYEKPGRGDHITTGEWTQMSGRIVKERES